MNNGNSYLISGNVMGGLGNQLFQIFTIISAALSCGKKFAFPFDEMTRVGLNRPTYWNNLLRELKCYTVPMIENSHAFAVGNEKPFTFDVNLMNAASKHNGNVFLKGYFQSYKYFDHFILQIKELLKLATQKRIIKNLFDAQLNATTVSLHFRVGDYVNYPDKHPILDVSYYVNALTFLSERTKIDRVLMFFEQGDRDFLNPRIDILKQQFPDIVFMEPERQIPDWSEMLLMSCCSHNIIANSSFSWWGAYLNDNINKIVCYPSVWYGTEIKAPSLDYMFPTSWACI